MSLNAFDEWCKENDMLPKPSKYHVLHVNFMKTPIQYPQLSLGGEILETVNNMKSLGLVIQNNLGWDVQELCEVFSRNSEYDPVHHVWGSPGHLFVTLNKGKQLKTYDIASQRKRSPSRKGSLFVDLSPSPIVQVCCFQKENSPAFIVYQNGLIEVWSYSYQDTHGQWAKAGYFILCDPGGSVISSVLLDEEHGRVFWVERALADGQKTNKWCVRTRTLSIDPSATEKAYSVGKAITLLVNCPPCNLYQTGGAVCIWPGSPSPPGLYFIWHSKEYSQSSHLNTCVLSQGCVQTTDCETALDLKAVAATFRHLWVQVVEQSDYDVIANVGCLSTGDLCLISSNGKVHSISGTLESLNICSIGEVVDVRQAKEWFVHRLMLGVITNQEISFLNLETGELVQQIDILQYTTVTDIHTWCIVGSVPKVGIWCEDGIWILQMGSVDKLSAKDQYRRQSSDTVFKFGQSQVATHSQLEDVYNQYSKGQPISVEEDGVKISDLVGEEGLQSPALVVAALQETSGGLQSEAQAIVEQLCEMYGIPGEGEDKQLLETPLNQQVLPLLRQYWGTHRALRQCFQKLDGRSVDMITSIETDIMGILSEDSMIPLDLKKSQLAFLISNWPREVLKSFVRQLKLGDINSKGDIHLHIPGPSDRSNASHPLTTLAVEAPESASGLPLFEIMCRLLYTQYPRYLVAFVEGTQRLRDRFRDISAFTRRKHALQLCNLAIQSLPSQSQDKEEGIRVRGQLLNMSGKTEYIQEALRSYLNHSMWEDAINLVKSHADHSRQHSQMFHILLSTAIKERRVFQQYNASIWECTPDTLSALDLLQFVQHHHKSPSSVFSQDVYCKPQDDLQLGQVKSQLLMMITQKRK